MSYYINIKSVYCGIEDRNQIPTTNTILPFLYSIVIIPDAVCMTPACSSTFTAVLN